MATLYLWLLHAVCIVFVFTGIMATHYTDDRIQLQQAIACWFIASAVFAVAARIV